MESSAASDALSAPAEATATAPPSTATARPNPATDPDPLSVTSLEVCRLCNTHFKSPVVASATRRNALTEPPSPSAAATPTTPSATVSPSTEPAPNEHSAISPLGVASGFRTASRVQRPCSVSGTALTSALDASTEKGAADDRANKNTFASPRVSP